MMHFPDHIQELASMQSDSERHEFIRNIDLENTRFEIKIADFGFSKKLKNKNQINKTICGTPLYMAP